jgi:hypothetical protein
LAIDGVLPSQAGNSGKYLKTDGSSSYWATVSGGTGTNDHGELEGLSDDDHTQYVLVDGSRDMTDDLSIKKTSSEYCSLYLTASGTAEEGDVGISAKDNSIYFRTGAANRMVLSGSGKLTTGSGIQTYGYFHIHSTSGPGYFSAYSNAPGLWLEDYGQSASFYIVHDGDYLQIQTRGTSFGSYTAAPLKIHYSAPVNSFYIDASGNVKADIGLYATEKIVIPLDQPTSLENGCIWIA